MWGQNNWILTGSHGVDMQIEASFSYFYAICICPYGIFYIRRGFSHRNQHFSKTRGREVRKWLYSVLKNKRLHGCVQLSSAGYVAGTESEGFFIPHTIPAGELGLYHERSSRTALAASAAVSEIWRRMATLSTQGAKRAISKLLYNKARVTPFELRRRCCFHYVIWYKFANSEIISWLVACNLLL